MPSFSLISRRLDYLHDSWLSVRKLYTQSELELIAHLAAPASHVHSRPVPPGYTLLTVAH